MGGGGIDVSSAAEDPVAVVRRYWEEAWGEGSLNALGEVLADPFRLNGETLRPEDFAKGVIGQRRSFPDFRVRVDDVFSVGDRVVSRVTYQGTMQGAWFRMPPTGRRIDVMGIDVFRIAHGKIVEHWHTVDHLEAMNQLGYGLTRKPDVG